MQKQSQIRCYVSGATDGLDYHHVVPRAYGGEDGPQIPLSGSVHTLVHSEALRLYQHRQDARVQYPDSCPPENRPRFLSLVRAIVTARDVYEKAQSVGAAPPPVKRIVVRGRRASRIEALALMLQTTEKAAVEAAIDRLYQSLTTKQQGDKNRG